jgi:integrase
MGAVTDLSTPASTLPASPAELDLAARIAQAEHDARGADAPTTRRTYEVAARAWAAWCAGQGHAITYPADPRAVAAWIDAIGTEGRAPATVRTYLAGLARAHRDLDLPSPGDAAVVRLAVRRLARTAATEGHRQRQAVPLRRDGLERALAGTGDDLLGLRDAALLALAYDSLCRASELAALRVRDVEPGAVAVGRSKTDQMGEGSMRFVAPDTWARVRRWIRAAQLRPQDPLFRPLGPAAKGDRLSTRDVARIVARRAGDAYSAHSTRVGAAVDQRAAGIATGAVAQSGGWSGDRMVARYTRAVDAAESGAAILARKQGRV